MDEDQSRPGGPPSEGNQFHKTIWLLCAFVPSLISIPCLALKSPPQWLAASLLIVNIFCSFFAGTGIVGGMKNKFAQAALGLFLVLFFFVANILIVICAGCSGMGRIAP